MMSILKILGIILAIIVVAGVIFWGVAYYNTMGSETIIPDGNVTGKALIVYDPGYSGETKNVATSMAQDLKTKGYEVKLAGVRSNDATNITGYDVMIFGSPTYAADPSGIIKSYLEGLNIPQNVTVGVFSTGSGADDQDSNQVMQEIIQKKNLTVMVSRKYDQTAVQNDYTQFISELLA